MQKRSITLAGHRTSVSLEPEFWAVLEDIARTRTLSLQKLVEEVDNASGLQNLASALRVHALAWVISSSAQTGR